MILTRCGKLSHAHRSTDRQISFLLFQQRARITAHIHVKAAEDEAKFWLEELPSNYGFSSRELNEIGKLATPEQRTKYEIDGGGTSLHWPDLDEDLSVANLMAGADFQTA